MRASSLTRVGLPAALVLLFVTVRLLQIAGGTVSFDDEEGFNLAAAWELARGVDLPWRARQLSDWEHGSLVVTQLAAPLAALLGPVLGALRLVALGLSLLTLGALLWVGRLQGGRGVALLAGLLFVLFPGPILHYSITAHGFHPDSTGFQLLYLALLIRASGDDRSHRRWLVAAGLAAGAALFMAYISAVVVLAGSLVLLVRTLKQPRRPEALVAYAAGLALGLVPLLIQLFGNEFNGLHVYGGRSLLDFLNPVGLLTPQPETVSAYLHFANGTNRESGLRTLFSVSFWLVTLAALAWTLRRGPSHSAAARPATMLPPILGVAVLVTVWVTVGSGHPVHPWHLVPLAVLLLVPLAQALVALWRNGRWFSRLAAVVILGGVALAGAWQNAAVIELDRLGLGFAVDGRNLPLFLRRLDVLAEQRCADSDQGSCDVQRSWRRLPPELALASRWESPFPHLFAGDLWQEKSNISNNLDAILAKVSHPQPGPQPPWFQLGYALSGVLVEGDAQRAARVWAALTPRTPRAVSEGIGFGLPLDRALTLLAEKDPDRRGPHGPTLSMAQAQAVAVGIGRAMPLGQMLKAPLGRCAQRLPRPLRAPFAHGLGLGLACRVPGPLPKMLVTEVCPSLRPALRRGVAGRGKACQTYRPSGLPPPQ